MMIAKKCQIHRRSSYLSVFSTATILNAMIYYKNIFVKLSSIFHYYHYD